MKEDLLNGCPGENLSLAVEDAEAVEDVFFRLSQSYGEKIIKGGDSLPDSRERAHLERRWGDPRLSPKGRS